MMEVLGWFVFYVSFFISIIFGAAFYSFLTQENEDESFFENFGLGLLQFIIVAISISLTYFSFKEPETIGFLIVSLIRYLIGFIF